MNGPDPRSELAWVRSVVEALAAETSVESWYLVGPTCGGSERLREMRVAAVWGAKTSVGMGPSALARGFGRSRHLIIDQLNRAEFLREWDPDFRTLTDRLVARLSDRIWVRVPA